MKKISLFIFFLVFISCDKKSEKSPVKQLEIAFNDHVASKSVLTEIEQLTPKDKKEAESVLTVLLKYSKAHPSWYTLSVMTKLADLHKYFPEKVKNEFLRVLNNYPPEDYYPNRDDRTVIFILDKLAKYSEKSPELRLKTGKALLELLKRIKYPVDPVSALRKKIAVLAPETGKYASRILFNLMNADNKLQYYSVKAKAAMSLGKITYTDVRLIPVLIKSLFILNNGNSISHYADFALTSASGKALSETVSVLKTMILHSYEILDNIKSCGKYFQNNQAAYCNLYKQALKKGWTEKDPILFERSAVKVLFDMKKMNVLNDLLTKHWSVEALSKRWTNEAVEFIKESGQDASKVHGVTNTPIQRINIASYMSDIFIREILMNALAKYEKSKNEIQKGAGFSGDVDFQLPVMDALSYFSPDNETDDVFIREIKSGTVWVTASVYYATLRNIAFKTVLDKSSEAEAMVSAWNSKNDEHSQWIATRPFWQPYLLKTVNNFKYEKGSDDKYVTNPHENYRLEAYKAAWLRADENFAEKLINIKPEELLATAIPPKDATSDSTFADYPWDENTEKLRKKEALKLIKDKFEEYSSLNSLISSCKKNAECYLNVLRGKSDKRFSKELFKTKALRMLMFYLKNKHLSLVAETYMTSGIELKSGLLDAIRRLSPPKSHPAIRKLLDFVKKMERKKTDMYNNMEFLKIYKTLPE